jgi:hypothetical protein
LLLRPGLFTSLLILLAVLIFVVRPIIPLGSILIMLLPALFVVLVFNPLAWAVAYLLYTAISGVISAAISAVATAILGPEATIPAAAISLGTALLATIFAFISRIIPLIAGAVYVFVIAPLLISGFGGTFGIFDVLFCLLIVYYFIFGGKKIPYLIILLVGVAMVYGYLLVGVNIINIVIGLALILLAAATIGLPVGGKIRNAVVKVLYLYLLASIGVRAVEGLWQYSIAASINRFMEALAGLGLLAVLTPAGMVLLVFLIGLFSGDPKIPDNLMKVLALAVILSFIIPTGAVSGFMYVNSLQWSAQNYIDELFYVVNMISPDTANNFRKFVGSSSAGGAPARYPSQYPVPTIFFQGEQVGGEIKQPREPSEAPAPGTRLGVEITPEQQPPPLGVVIKAIVDYLTSSLRNFSLLGASLLIIFIAYVLDLMAGTIGYDIFGARPVAEAITKKPPEEKYKAYAEEAMEKVRKVKKAEEETTRRVVTAIGWRKVYKAVKALEEAEEEAERAEKMLRILKSEEVQRKVAKGMNILELRKAPGFRARVEAAKRRFELGDRIINALKKTRSVLVTKVMRPVSGKARKVTIYRIIPYKKKGEKK